MPQRIPDGGIRRGYHRNLVDVVQKARLQTRNLQKRKTEKTTKSIESAFFRPFLGHRAAPGQRLLYPSQRASDQILHQRATGVG